MKQLRLSDFLKATFQVRGVEAKLPAWTVQALYTSIITEHGDKIISRVACLCILCGPGMVLRGLYVFPPLELTAFSRVTDGPAEALLLFMKSSKKGQPQKVGSLVAQRLVSSRPPK